MQAHFSAEQTDQRNGPGLAPSETGVGRCGARPAVPDTRCFHASSPTATELHERANERAMSERASAPPPSRPLSLVVCVYGRVSERPVRSSKACARDGGDLLRILLFLVPLVRRRLSVSLPPSPATPPAAPLPVAEKESGGHATGGGATDARWRGETERRDSGRCRGRTAALLRWYTMRSLCREGWRATYPLLPPTRSLAVATVASLAHGERGARQENGNARDAAKSKHDRFGSSAIRMDAAIQTKSFPGSPLIRAQK